MSRTNRRTLRLVFAALGLLLLGGLMLVGVVLYRTAAFTSRQVRVDPAAIELDTRAAATRLAGSIRFRTVSRADSSEENEEEFLGLVRYLETTFPRTHAALRLEVLHGASMLFRWDGSDADRAPVLLTAHLDVVPADETASEVKPHAAEMVQGVAQALIGPGEDHSPDPMTIQDPPVEGVRSDDAGHNPFDGDMDEYVWGRGTLDDKVGVVGILEAVEMLLEQGYRPRRTILLAFGRDEEVGGLRGAQAMARLLDERGTRPAFVLDEGTPILRDALPGLEPPVALVGVAEKGYVSLELVAKGRGGHSSSPPDRTAIGLLSRAVGVLESQPRRARLDGVSERFFGHIGPEMGFAQRIVFANLWLSRPLVVRRLAAEEESSPLVRTTTAATIIAGGTQENVLPREARAVVNLRLLPGDSAQELIEAIRELVGGPDLTVRFVDEAQALDPSAISPTDNPPFQAIERTIREVFPGTIVAPFLVTAGTDARFYEVLTPAVYRFLPVELTHEDVTRIHGVGERISVEGYGRAVRFYYQLIRNVNSLEPRT